MEDNNIGPNFEEDHKEPEEQKKNYGDTPRFPENEDNPDRIKFVPALPFGNTQVVHNCFLKSPR